MPFGDHIEHPGTAELCTLARCKGEAVLVLIPKADQAKEDAGSPRGSWSRESRAC